jgi:hypothetical protein
MNRAGTMRALVACESRGRVWDALNRSCVYAMSCDLEPSESPGHHIVGDVRALLAMPWDLIIAHPPCTRLCNSGVPWLAERDLWAEMREGAEFFTACLDANAPMVAVENPMMHKYAREIVGCGPDFTI